MINPPSIHEIPLLEGGYFFGNVTQICLDFSQEIHTLSEQLRSDSQLASRLGITHNWIKSE
jgi:hypothetical protein